MWVDVFKVQGCCCCCRVPQLNTEGHPVMCTHTCTYVQVPVQSIGWEGCVCDRFKLPCHVRNRTPSSEDFISLTKEWGLLFPEFTMAEDNPHTTRYNNFFTVGVVASVFSLASSDNSLWLRPKGQCEWTFLEERGGTNWSTLGIYCYCFSIFQVCCSLSDQIQQVLMYWKGCVWFCSVSWHLHDCYCYCYRGIYSPTTLMCDTWFLYMYCNSYLFSAHENYM